MRRNASLGLGLALCAAGILVALSPGPAALAALVTRYWPLLPIAAGAFSLAGFALARRPRTPVWGAVLLAGGGLALAVTLQHATTPLALYGRFWPLVLGVVALAEILKHYTYEPGMGDRPALFSAGKLALVGLVVTSGLAADRLSGTEPTLFAGVAMPAGFDRIRDQLFGEEFEFAPLVGSAPLGAGGTLTVTNRLGDVTIEAADVDAVEVALTPRVQAYDRAAAERVAAALRLLVEPSGADVSVSTNRDAIDHEIETDMKLRVPRGAALRVVQAHGGVTVAGVAGGGVRVQASHAPITLRGVAAPVEVTSAFGAVRVERSSGSLDVRGRNDVTVRGFDGSVRLEDADSVSIADVRGGVDLVSVDHASVSIENVAASAAGPAAAPPSALVSVEGTHTSVKLKNIAGDARVKTTHDNVRASDIGGALEVEAQHADVDVSNVVRSLRVRTSHDDVRARNIGGPVDIENDHGDVRVSDFQSACTVRTTYDGVRLEAADRQAGPILVENEHGKIDVRLPASGVYALEPTVERGKVRVDDAFARAAGAAGGVATRVVLKTTHDDIVVRAV